MHSSNPASFVEEMIDELLSEHSEPLDLKDDPANKHSKECFENNADKLNKDTSMDSIQLSDECTIYEIAHIHQKIHAQWQAQNGLSLDLSAVTEVDASFIQLLSSCKKTAIENKQSFELFKPSEAVTQKIKAMFLSDYFNSEKTAEPKKAEPKTAEQ